MNRVPTVMRCYAASTAFLFISYTIIYIIDAIPLDTKNSSPNFSDKSKTVPFGGLLLLHLFKHKVKYQKLEKVPTTPATIDCICVPYYLCNANNTIITDGIGVIDVRFRRCTGDLEVCCKLPSVTQTMAPVVTPTPTTTTTTTPKPTTTSTTTTTPKPTTTSTTTTTTTTTTPPPIIFPPQPPIVINPPPNINCVCVPINQCDASNIVVSYGEGAIDPRQQLGLCGVTNLVCCRYPLPPVTYPQPNVPGTQVCVVCNGGVIQCGLVLLPGTGIIDPRLPVLQGSTCSNTGTVIVNPGNVGTGCCQTFNSPACCQSNIAGCCQNPVVIQNQAAFVQPVTTSTTTTTTTTTPGPLMFANTPQACYCVKSWFCSEGNAVSPDGLGIIDPRFTACKMADEVCCKPQGIARESEVRDLLHQDIIIGNDRDVEQITAGDSSCGVPNTILSPVPPYPLDSGRTYFGEFPWMVALFIKRSDSYLFLCGASMINNRAVLTAAHCIATRDPGTLVARFGVWEIENGTVVNKDFQEIVVESVVTHPQFYKAGLFHDVAVLVLGTAVKYDVNVRPICLPVQGASFLPGTRCYASGWGRSAIGGQFQSELRKVDLPIVSRTDCQNRLRSTRLGQYFQLHGSFMCAGGEPNRDTCNGDGGGPLVCRTASGTFTQVGIVSWGVGCGQSNVPAVYSSVSLHRQWIDQQLANYGVL